MGVGELPRDLPVPVDDGAADHLIGLRLPSVRLPSTSGEPLDVSRLPGWTVLFAYPRTARPDEPPAALETWTAIPGARGCTPQACGYRDLRADFAELDARVLGVSAQPPDEQLEAASRLGLPFPLLSDAAGRLAAALALPTFEFDGRLLLKRLTLVVEAGAIRHVFYPVFPPDANARVALDWLRSR